MDEEKIVGKVDIEVVDEEMGIEFAEEVEIEILIKRGEKVPLARRYIVRIDSTKYTITTPVATGSELLALVGKTPETHKLYQHVKGNQPNLVEPNEEVDLRESGVERFTTMPKDTTEGQDDLAPRREFRMPPSDEEYLNSLDLKWEAVKDGSILWAIIHGWFVPSGYDKNNVSLALMIPGDYPDTQIDMVYFRPALARSDGGEIKALAGHTMFGETWQRWSRHRTAANPWRVGEDDISTHLTLIDDWLRREVH